MPPARSASPAPRSRIASFRSAVAFAASCWRITMIDRCHFRRAIDRHFAGTIAVSAESALRTHLPTCGACDAYYRRHLLLEAMTPNALGPQQRLSRALGIARPVRRRWWVQLATATAIAGVLAFVAIHRDGGMTERGGAPPASQLIAF